MRHYKKTNTKCQETKASFTIVENVLAQDPDLGPEHWGTYFILRYLRDFKTNKTQIGFRKLAKAAHKDVVTMRKYVSLLEKKGHIKRKRIRRKKGTITEYSFPPNAKDTQYADPDKQPF